MENFFKQTSMIKNFVKKDRHKFYPHAVRSINGKHVIVSHDAVFKNKVVNNQIS